MKFATSRPEAARPNITSVGHRHAVAVVLVLAAALISASHCRAGLVISAPDITAASGSSGSFLVLITDTDPLGSTPFHVLADSIKLTLTGAGVTFTAATTSSSNGGTPYIYTDSFSNDFLGGSIDFAYPASSFPATSFIGADSSADGITPTILNPGDVFALGLISYTVDRAATPGNVVTIGFADLGGGTSLADEQFNPVIPGVFTTQSGSIMITVPEPSTLLLAGIGGGLLFLRLRFGS
jgi:hypothetical protein